MSSAQKTHSRTLYLVVYVALLVLLVITVALSFVDLGRHANNIIAMAIACIKGLLIVLFFMHVRFEPWITWFFAAAGFLWLGIMLTLTGSEYLTRNHPAGMNPKGEPTYLQHRPPAGPSEPELTRGELPAG